MVDVCLSIAWAEHRGLTVSVTSGSDLDRYL